MKKGRCKPISLLCLLGSLLFLMSSCVNIAPGARYERQEEVSSPLEPGSSFSAETRDGSLAIEGTAAAECRLLATIVTRARSPERAQELAEQIHVRLEPVAQTLTVVIERPAAIRNAHYSVSLAGTVPHRTHLALKTSDGSVHVADIQGRIEATTSDGSIHAEATTGDTRLKTSDGSITCAQADGDNLDLRTSDGSIRLSDALAKSCSARTSDGSITLTNVRADGLDVHTSDGGIRCHNIAAARLTCRTSDGSIRIECAPDAPKVLDATVTTSDGSITFAAPPGLSAVVEASTSNGSIHTDLPITIEGRVGKSLHGTIGDGQGTLTLRTHDGSITLR